MTILSEVEALILDSHYKSYGATKKTTTSISLVVLLSHQLGCCEMVSASCSTNWESCDLKQRASAKQPNVKLGMTKDHCQTQLPEWSFPSKAHFCSVNNAQLLSWGSPINTSTLEQKFCKYLGVGLYDLPSSSEFIPLTNKETGKQIT